VPALLVALVVAPRPVGAGHLEGELLLVEVAPAQAQPHHSHQHDPAPLAARGGGLVDDGIGLGRGGDEDAVHAATAAPLEGGGHGVVTGAHGVGPEAAGQLPPAGHRIHPQHPAAVGPQELDGELAQEPQAHDQEPLAQGGRGQADALEGDGAQHGEAGLGVGDFVGDAGAEVRGHADELGVGTVGGHPVAGPQAGHPGPDLHDDAGVAVAQGERLVQLAEHRLQRGGDAVGAHLVQHLPHLLGLAPRLADPPRLSKLH